MKRPFTRLTSAALAVLLCLLAGCSKAEPQQPVEPTTPPAVETPAEPAVDPAQAEQEAFDAFILREFQDTLKRDYTSMHQTLVNPENYGIDRLEVPVNLGEALTEEFITKAKEENAKLKAEFEGFDYDLLREDQKETYAVYQFELKSAMDSLEGDFAYMRNIFSPMAGLQNALSSFFMEYDLRTPQDVADYLTLMNNTLDYVNGMLEYTKAQAEKGFGMSNNAADETIAYCDKILSSGDDSALLAAILANIDTFDQLNDEEKASYKAQAEEAFKTSILPAYTAIRDTISSLKSDENNQLGLAHFDKGRDYYAMLFRHKTGSSRSIEETKLLLQQYMENALYNLVTIATQNPDAHDAYINNSVSTGYKDFDEILSALYEFKDENFPAIQPVEYTIDYLDPEVAVDGVVAYYVIPPLDSDVVQKMKVNPREDTLDPGSLDTFITIAHEGLPGHLYQHNYILQNMTDPYRLTTSFSGYSEGYATYVELLALEYLPMDPDIAAVAQNYSVFQNSLIALCDIGIHYDGWSVEEMQEFMDQYLSVDAAEIYKQLQGDPAAFLPYYVGYMEFMEMKQNAQVQMGDKFNEKDFHTAILKSGIVPFDLVKKNVDAYVASAK